MVTKEDCIYEELFELLTCHRDAPCLHLEQTNKPFSQHNVNLYKIPEIKQPDPKESHAPYPWKEHPGSTNAVVVALEKPPQTASTTAIQRPDISKPLARFMDEGQALGTIEFQTPKPNLSAGAVLQHAIRRMEALFSKEEPLIFKVGWTHDPIWQWGNTMYGYKFARDCWAGMVVLFASHEPHGPAFLEAALIDRYQSNLDRIEPEILHMILN